MAVERFSLDTPYLFTAVNECIGYRALYDQTDSKSVK
jgi:hypothetical protein